jgi:bacillolysin
VIAAAELRTASCPGVFDSMLDPNAPPLCGGGLVDPILSTDFEAGLGGFTVGQVPTNSGTWDARDWTIVGALPNGRTGSAAYGPDPVIGDCQTDLENGKVYLQSPPIAVPGSATAPIHLAFDHYASMELQWDGGNLKYSTNGTTWNIVPASAFTFNAYNDTLNTAGAGNDNPMAGEAAFTGANDGAVTGSWGQSQIDLSLIGIDPGDTLHLRWELGTDGCNGWDGWYVDAVEVYSCEVLCSAPSDVPWLSAAPTAGSTVPSAATPVAVTLDSTGLAPGTYEASLCVSSNDPVTPVVAVPVTLDVTGP